LLVVEGLKPAPTFNHRIEYGQMWHVCEEAHAKCKAPWIEYLQTYVKMLCEKFRTQQEQIQHWYFVCQKQFPLYVEYWEKCPDVKQRTPLLQEQVFDVPYKLPSGRTVRLRGKWDSVDLIGKGKNAGVYLQENKTKGDINEEQLKRQLSSGFDLQTMMYLVALKRASEGDQEDFGDTHIWQVLDGSPYTSGIRYNVVRRPLSGGKGSIIQHKPSKSNPAGETAEGFYSRLAGVIAEDPGYFFMRWKVEVTPQDLARFRRECLDPVLEQLCDWWERMQCSLRAGADSFTHAIRGDGPMAAGRHYRFPYGVYNVLLEGGSSELDEYLATGSTLGLVRNAELFGELS
jgi:hypothetical protein